MPRLSARFVAVILCLAPLLHQRSWRHAEVLLIGAILAPAAPASLAWWRRTEVAAFMGGGRAGRTAAGDLHLCPARQRASELRRSLRTRAPSAPPFCCVHLPSPVSVALPTVSCTRERWKAGTKPLTRAVTDTPASSKSATLWESSEGR